MDLERLPELLRETVGPRARVAAIESLKWRQDYTVLLVNVEQPETRVVVELAGPKAELACPFERTAQLHRLVASRTGLDMPEILGVDTSYGRYPWRYLVKTHIAGVEWVQVRQQMSARERAHAFWQLGHVLAELHYIHFDSFGELTADAEVEHGQSCLEALQARSRERIRPPVMRERFLELLEQRSAWFEGVKRSCLTHEDLHQHNLIFDHQCDAWRLATILGFDKAWAGHGESDLARLALWRGMSHPLLWKAYYGLEGPEPGWRERRPVYQLLWCLEYARNTTAHLADTRRLCEQLGVKFERFE